MLIMVHPAAELTCPQTYLHNSLRACLSTRQRRDASATMAADQAGRDAFNRAKMDFEKELNDPGLLNDILSISTPGELWDAMHQIQTEQESKGQLRYLKKVTPYLDCLAAYAGVVEVFVQVKPDVLALVWGPIKFLLLWSSQLKQSFDAVINTMTTIGELLPRFQRTVEIFKDAEKIREVLALFFEDILDFYLAMLKLFRKSCGLPRSSNIGMCGC